MLQENGVTLPQQWEEGLIQQSNHFTQKTSVCFSGGRVFGLHTGCTWQWRKSICNEKLESPFHNSRRKGYPSRVIDVYTLQHTHKKRRHKQTHTSQNTYYYYSFQYQSKKLCPEENPKGNASLYLFSRLTHYSREKRPIKLVYIQYQ